MEGESSLRRLPAAVVVQASGLPRADLPPAVPASDADARQRLLQFWQTHRAAMDAMKVEQDRSRAIRLFREAIALNPRYEDARYYLGQCLAAEGDVDGALAALEGLQQLNPQSHRAWQQWGVIHAVHARHADDLVAAECALERAHALNSEETGALLVLGEVALLRGNPRLAEERLLAATHTNPRAAGGFFLLGYLVWKRGDAATARQYLEKARAALGPDWQPKGATSEGDVRRKHHTEPSPLMACWADWNGRSEPDTAFAALEARLRH